MCGGQRAQALQPLVQNSAQMPCVAKAADGDAVQVHGLHKVAQQRPLQAQDVPSEEGKGPCLQAEQRDDKTQSTFRNVIAITGQPRHI